MALLTISEADNMATSRGYTENLLQFTEEFSEWTTSDVTIVEDSADIINPIGFLETTKCTPGSDAVIRQTIPITANIEHMFSLYVYSPSGSKSFHLRSFNAAYDTEIDSGEVTALEGVWTRVSLSTNPGAEINMWFQLGGSSTWSTGEIVYLWGAQVSVGELVLDYIAGDQQDAPTFRSQDSLHFFHHPRQMSIGDNI